MTLASGVFGERMFLVTRERVRLRGRRKTAALQDAGAFLESPDAIRRRIRFTGTRADKPKSGIGFRAKGAKHAKKKTELWFDLPWRALRTWRESRRDGSYSSRWLSEATPPVCKSHKPAPGKGASHHDRPRVSGVTARGALRSHSGSGPLVDGGSGGVARSSLNHRLLLLLMPSASENWPNSSYGRPCRFPP